MDKIELKALGKINLGLDILGRRDNGYHDVRMVMQTVFLYDRVILEKSRKPGIEIVTNLNYLPANENNIAYKAAKLLADEFRIRDGIRITLEKHIPVAAGMAVRGRTQGAGREAGGRCSLLYYAWDCTGRGNRRNPYPACAHAQMLYLNSQAGALCFYQNRI